jgi:integrase
MASVTTYLDNKEKDGNRQLFYRYRHEGKKTDIASGLWVQPGSYKPAVKAVFYNVYSIALPNLKFKNKEDQNAYNRQKNEIYSILDFAIRFKTKPTVGHFKNELLKTFNLKHEIATEYETVKTVPELIKDYLASIKETQARITYQTKENTFNQVKAFIGKRPPADLMYFNLSFYENFKRYLASLGDSPATIAKKFRHLKTWLYWCADIQGQNISKDVKRFKGQSKPKQVIFLDEDEINALFALRGTLGKLDNLALDYFLLGCFTGLRISDLQRITPAHRQGDYLIIQQAKTSKPATPYLLPQAIEILDHYNNKMPYMSRGQVSEYIKDIAVKVDINYLVEYDGRTNTKDRFLSTHVARKSFISLCQSKGIPAPAVAEMVGTTVKTILAHYTAVNQKTITNSMVEAFGL